MVKRKAESMLDDGLLSAPSDAIDVVESPSSSEVMICPTDSGYLESLKEPFHSMAMKVIAAATTDSKTATGSDEKGEGDTGKQTIASGVDIAHHCLDELEMSLRSRLLDIFNSSNEDENKIRSLVGNYWKSTVDLCQYLVHTCCSESTKSKSLALSSPKQQQQKKNSTTSSTANAYGGIRKLPLLLLEDILDGLSVEDSQQFWLEYVEPILDDVLLGGLLWKSSNVCHLPFLRVGNHFLRVIENASHSQEQEWKGRVLLAFSKAFSITDRSALKLWGSFHTNKVTKFESKDDYSNSNASTGKRNQDYDLYEAFWSLQSDFSNPNRIQFAAFTKKMKLVLAALESSTVASTSTATATTEDSSSTPTPESVRYLTSSSLLSTQMASSEFRSSVLIQFLIIGNHLSAESPPLANALSGLIATSRKLLKQDSPELFDILNSILQNSEAQWRKWKKEKCPVSAFAPKQPAASDTTEPKKRPRLLDGPLGGGSSKRNKSEYDLNLDTEELVEISQQLADKVPSLEKHLEPYVEALDPESGIEDDYHPKNDPLYCWRTMRLMRIHQPLYLKDCRQPADLELVTRELYKDKGEEIPGKYVPPPKNIDSDSSSDDAVGSEKDNTDNDEDRSKNDNEGAEDDNAVAAESATSSKAGSIKGDNDQPVDDRAFDDADADEDGGSEAEEKNLDTKTGGDDEGMDVENEPKDVAKPETADDGREETSNFDKEGTSKDVIMSDAENADDEDEKNGDKDLQSPPNQKTSEQKIDDDNTTAGDTGNKPQEQDGRNDGDIVKDDEEKADAKKQQHKQMAVSAKKSPPPTAGQKKAPQRQSSQKDTGNNSNQQQQRPRSTPRGGGGGGGGGRRGDVRKGGGGGGRNETSRGRSVDDGPRGGGQNRGGGGGGGGGGRQQDSQPPSTSGRRHDEGPSRRNDNVRRGGRDNDGGQPSRRHDEGGGSDSYRVMASSERERGGGGGGQGRESLRDGGRGGRVSQRDGRAGGDRGDRRDRDRESDRRDRDSDRRDRDRERDRDDRHGGGGGGGRRYYSRHR